MSNARWGHRANRNNSSGLSDRGAYALATLLPWVCLLVAVLVVSGALRSSSGGVSAGETPAFGVAETRRVVLSFNDGDGGPARVEVLAEVADSDVERETGLMGRPSGSLPEDGGMLFVFDREQDLSFWMKDTHIPLSVAYADADGRIVDVQDMEPLDRTLHPSVEPAMYALEVNHGFFEEHGIGVGDSIVAGLGPRQSQPRRPRGGVEPAGQRPRRPRRPGRGKGRQKPHTKERP